MISIEAQAFQRRDRRIFFPAALWWMNDDESAA
jgi:hypothetical protein